MSALALFVSGCLGSAGDSTSERPTDGPTAAGDPSNPHEPSTGPPSGEPAPPPPRRHEYRLRESEEATICTYVTRVLMSSLGCSGPGGNGLSFNMTRNVTAWSVELTYDEDAGRVRTFYVAGADNIVRYYIETSDALQPGVPLRIADEGTHWQNMLDVFGEGSWSTALHPWYAVRLTWNITIEKTCLVREDPLRECGVDHPSEVTDLGPVDEILEPPPDPFVPWSDDMESPPGGWTQEQDPAIGTIVGEPDVWSSAQDAGWHPTTITAHAGQSAWHGGRPDGNGFDGDARVVLVSPVIDGRGAANLTLRYWLRTAADESDAVVIWARPQASTGFQWKVLDVVHGGVTDWTLGELPLSQFAGMRFQVGFYLRTTSYCRPATGLPDVPTFTSCGQSSVGGFFLDDVSVSVPS